MFSSLLQPSKALQHIRPALDGFCLRLTGHEGGRAYERLAEVWLRNRCFLNIYDTGADEFFHGFDGPMVTVCALLQIHVKLDSPHEAASAYVEAAKCYQKTNKTGRFFTPYTSQTSSPPYPYNLETPPKHRLIFPQMSSERCTKPSSFSQTWAGSAWQQRI